MSRSIIILVGDPRQVTYLTHHAPKYSQYRDGKIKQFVEIECNQPNTLCDIDEESLIISHRNNDCICQFSSSIFPEYAACKPCTCKACKKGDIDHYGIFAIKPEDVAEYCKRYRPQILHYSNSQFPNLNFGKSKGLGFDRVLIYPTEKIKKYLITGKLKDIDTVRAKFYVAITRARHSAGIVCDFDNDTVFIQGISKYKSDGCTKGDTEP